MGQDAQELVLPLVEQPQRLGVDAQRLGLARVGDVFDGQQHDVRLPAALDRPAVEHQPAGAAPDEPLDLEIDDGAVPAQAAFNACRSEAALQIPRPVSQMLLPSIWSAVSPRSA